MNGTSRTRFAGRASSPGPPASSPRSGSTARSPRRSCARRSAAGSCRRRRSSTPRLTGRLDRMPPGGRRCVRHGRERCRFRVGRASTSGKGWRRSHRRSDRTDPDAVANRGYVASANGNLARTRRIEQLLNAQPAFGIDDFTRMQHDTLAWNAERLVPLLAPLRAGRAGRRGRAPPPAPLGSAADRRVGCGDRLRVVGASSVARARPPGRSRPRWSTISSPARATLLVPALTRPSRAWFGRITGAGAR